MTRIIRGTNANDCLLPTGNNLGNEIIKIFGYDGNDRIEGSTVNPNQLYGGAGSDYLTISGSSRFNIFDGGAGDDNIDALSCNGFSRILGGAGDDYIVGSSGGSYINGGAGTDTMDGGEGGDTYVVDTLHDAIYENYHPFYAGGPNPADQVNAWVSWTLGANLENLVLQGKAAINGTGNGLSNLIVGNAGNNSLSGGRGFDTLEGGLGNDTIDGGAGLDTVRFTVSTAVVTNLSKTAAQDTGLGKDMIRNVENVVTGAGNDRVTGSAAANMLTAGSGNDTLSGQAGNDRLSGQAGNDRLHGGAGNDILSGGTGADQFLFSAGGGTDRITDFADGIDRIVIDSGAETFRQIRIADLGADARITFGDVTITMTNIDHARLGADDFTFT